MNKNEAIALIEDAQVLMSEAIEKVKEVFDGDGNVEVYWINHAEDMLFGHNPHNLNLRKLVEKIEDGECEAVDYHEYDNMEEDEPEVKLNANDDSDEALEAAHYNYDNFVEKLGPDDFWCDCLAKHEKAYFRNNEAGCHGWMCVMCKKVTQTG